jgi:hypothetical protein
MNIVTSIIKWIAYLFVFIGLLSLILFIIIFIRDGNFVWFGSLNFEDASKIGDFIGGFVGIFWTIAGVFLLFLTLQLQRNEFKETQLAIAKQQFETTFFNMLSMLQNIINSINGEIDTKVYGGHLFLHNALLKLKSKFNGETPSEEVSTIYLKIENAQDISPLEYDTIKCYITNIYEEFYSEYYSELGHYFRYIFNLIKFITDTELLLNESERIKYINIIQSQLTHDDLGLIFYNATSKYGLNQRKQPQFYNWLETYEFLENMDSKSLFMRAHHSLYIKTKFKFLNNDELKIKKTKSNQRVN